MAKQPLAISIASISTLIFATANLANFASTAPASASTIVDGTEYWTFSEVLDLEAEFKAESEAICHGDYECEDELLWSHMEEEPRYWALDMVGHFGLTATEINPSRETVTIFYNDSPDRWMARLDIEEEPLGVGNLYLFWLDEGMNDPLIYMHYMQDYVAAIQANDIPEGLHLMVAKNNDLDGTGWLPAKEFVEFSVAGSDLAQNPSGVVHVWFGSEDPDRTFSIGSFQYPECTSSPNYEEGMDCRLVFSEDGMRYLPFEHQEPTQGLGAADAEEELAVKVPLAPDTGAIAKESDTTESLWPFVILAIFGVIFAVWLFGPEHKTGVFQKSQKNKRFFEKSLDKNIKVR